MMMCSTSSRSSLELMLDSIRQRDEQPTDAPPALPVRPVSKARLPPARRGFPVNFRKCGLWEDVKEKEDRREEGESNFKLGLFESNRLKIELLDATDDQRERLLEGILEIQKYFRGHQARCYYIELKRGTVALQSFVRGEKARKDYQELARRLAAVIVIQQHTKKWIEWRIMHKRQRAAICMQSVIRGWSTRKCLKKGNIKLPGIGPLEDIRKPDWRSPETKDYIRVSPSVLPNLQRRLLRVETELGQKEEENAVLRQKLQQFDEKWSQYEAKMKSMEKTWQDQLTSLQMSLAAAKKSLASEGTRNQNGTFDPFPLYHSYGDNTTMPVGTQAMNGRRELDFSDLPCHTEPQESNSRLNDINHLRDQRKKVFHDSVGKLKPVHLASISMSPDDELRKLKLRFESWKKDYRARLHEIKATLLKLGRSETKNSRTKWWGK
ncbi:Myosin-1 like [Actinidia chinensis var. chinensis]|uniref:Myosin-1 like n=1 Tax=Actinidia chinensis var. chinensis TaxID=1590841 RepID=A0A2R6RAV4_ACTCC|nr:Myosin-1 like [Actinidia chinensis var. chinensis]